jgi:hypothetical protein
MFDFPANNFYSMGNHAIGIPTQLEMWELFQHVIPAFWEEIPEVTTDNGNCYTMEGFEDGFE